MHIFNVMPASLVGLCDLAPDTVLDIGEEDIIGLDDKHVFERQEQARFRKTSKWLNHPITKDKLLSLAMSIQFSLRIMGAFFTAAKRFGNEGLRSMIRLVNLNTSPVAKCIRRYFAVLADETHECWHVMSEQAFCRVPRGRCGLCCDCIGRV